MFVTLRSLRSLRFVSAWYDLREGGCVKANSLLNEKSPYLKSAAYQPVDWLPWSSSAFEKAKHENKPVLLAIGATWCHWCHAMDHDNYENVEAAELINAQFVPIKVDRDERPEIDRRYQAAVAAMNGEGGWPLTAFLTPEGDLFAGGTYFSPTGMPGRRGFRDVLQDVAETYKTAGASVRASAQQIRSSRPLATAAHMLEPEMSEHAAREMVRDFDFIHGGFGEGPRFPLPCALDFLMASYFRSKDQNVEGLIRKALDRMATGAIRDQIGGGFHRYAAGPDWSRPHFEKLLADNAEMLRIYARGFALFQQPLYREAAQGILQWVTGSMCHPEGGFHHSQDADVSAGDDGGYYTWTMEELQGCLTEKELQVLSSYYTIRNMAGANILHNDRPLEDVADELKIAPALAGALLAAAKDKLAWERTKRLQPPVDPRVFTGSTALMITACWEAGHILEIPDAIALGNRAFDSLVNHTWYGKYFNHAADHPVQGFLDDQVYGAIALLDAYLLTSNPNYLQLCATLAGAFINDYYDSANGGFFDIASDGRSNLPPLKPVQDTPAPGPNAAAAMLFSRLYSITGDAKYRETARHTLQAFASEVALWNAQAGGYFLALQQYFDGALDVYVMGDPENAGTAQLLKAAWQTYRPRKQIRKLPSNAVLADPAGQGMIEFIRSRGTSMAFVCVEGSCAAPVDDPDDLRNLILTFNL